jgi:hypothetical protein
MSERETSPEAGPGRARRGRARRWRLVLSILHATCVSVTLGVGIVLVLELRDPSADRGRRLAPQTVEIPPALPADLEPVVLAPAGFDRTPPFVTPSAVEDALILDDAFTDFSRAWRVIFAGLETQPLARTCILAQRDGGEQITLTPGDRIGGWILIRIEPRPRSVVLGFRELRRGEDFEITLDAEQP